MLHIIRPRRCSKLPQPLGSLAGSRLRPSQNTDEEKQCKFWLQGKCIHGDRCKFGHGQPLQSSAALYEPREAIRRGPYSGVDVIGQKRKPREAHESEIGVPETYENAD